MYYKLLLTGILLAGFYPVLAQQPIPVWYINSYHDGYGSSDSVMAGIRQTLAKTGKVHLTVFFLDTKRQPEGVGQRAAALKARFDTDQPKLVIASDDDAVREFVVPYLKNTPTPVVFCGVNWSAAVYGLPVPNVTGMLEIVPIRETLRAMRQYYPRARRLTVLSENSPTERRNTALLDTLYRNMGFEPRYELVEEFAAWKTAFKRANDTSDLIYLPTNGGIQHWNTEEASEFVRQTIRKPVVACDDFMMPFAVYGQTKVAREQGIWAAETALRILAGASPGDFPLVQNRQSERWFNPALAQKIKFTPKPSFLTNCHLLP